MKKHFFHSLIKQLRHIKASKLFDNSSNVYQKKLLDTGWVKFDNLLNNQLLDNILNKYNLHVDNFVPFNANMSLPCLDYDIINFIINNSQFNNTLNKYFITLYNKKPVLQSPPAFVITYPTITQDEYRYGLHNIPAVFHTDYPYEFSVHIPILDINRSTSHTIYLERSCMSSSISPNSIFDNSTNEVLINKFKESRLYANVGDILFLDVTGMHKAQINQNIRIMIQLKYTVGNNILSDLSGIWDSDKFINQVKETKSHFSSMKTYTKVLLNDYNNYFIDNNYTLPVEFAVIQNSQKYYKAYMELF